MLQNLGDYKVDQSYSVGRPLLIQMLWVTLGSAFVASSLPGSMLRSAVLRAFGAKIGRGVVLKPRIRIKFPWKLEVGDNSWVGEGVWIDNLGHVYIGDRVCVSQMAYFCTGSHNWDRTTFNLIVKPIHVENDAWIAAASTIGPGVVVREGAVLGLGSVATGDLISRTIYRGNPAEPVRQRIVS